MHFLDVFIEGLLARNQYTSVVVIRAGEGFHLTGNRFTRYSFFEMSSVLKDEGSLECNSELDIDEGRELDQGTEGR